MGAPHINIIYNKDVTRMLLMLNILKDTRNVELHVKNIGHLYFENSTILEHHSLRLASCNMDKIGESIKQAFKVGLKKTLYLKVART